MSCWAFKKYKNSQSKALELEIRQKKKKQPFFQRWEMLDAKVTVSDIFMSLDYLSQTKVAFEKVCSHLFPEVQLVTELNENRPICQELLVFHSEELTVSNRIHFTNVLQVYDVVKMEKCTGPHYMHYGCIIVETISSKFLSDLSDPSKNVQVIWIQDLKQKQHEKTQIIKYNIKKNRQKKFQMEKTKSTTKISTASTTTNMVWGNLSEHSSLLSTSTTTSTAPKKEEKEKSFTSHPILGQNAAVIRCVSI